MLALIGCARSPASGGRREACGWLAIPAKDGCDHPGKVPPYKDALSACAVRTGQTKSGLR